MCALPISGDPPEHSSIGAVPRCSGTAAGFDRGRPRQAGGQSASGAATADGKHATLPVQQLRIFAAAAILAVSELQALGLDYANRRGHAPAGRLNCCARSHAAKRCRSEEHTSELQYLMRISYAVFCLKKKNNNNTYITSLHVNLI